MAVHPGWHRRGLRGRMVGAAVARCRKERATTLLVKTLADSHPSEEYAQTRAFYRAMGLGSWRCFPTSGGLRTPAC
jgi:GNAT superfamily N-acetyltransferase